jgi:hypothetical protein
MGATIVTLECAAVLPSSEAEDVVGHIEEVWRRGKEAIDVLRAALGPVLQDVLCPLINGGVCLHKLFGIMHDTCNCANLVQHCLCFIAFSNPSLLFELNYHYKLGCKIDAGSTRQKVPGAFRRRCLGISRTQSESLFRFSVW